MSFFVLSFSFPHLFFTHTWFYIAILFHLPRTLNRINRIGSRVQVPISMRLLVISRPNLKEDEQRKRRSKKERSSIFFRKKKDKTSSSSSGSRSAGIIHPGGHNPMSMAAASAAAAAQQHHGDRGPLLPKGGSTSSLTGKPLGRVPHHSHR